ncbi:MAG TPA: phosphohistidine phosphatase SixA [Gemmatimonadaceae bacterium]|nr:phosphohistidine phosphatase SixA [Gemmatimonadaceae bacterium]
MRLIVVRHAIAEDRDEFAASGHDDDRLRPLTADGARKMKRGAEGLRSLVASIDLLASSPLVRAAETAEIIRDAYGIDRVVTEASLVPEGGVADVVRWLATRGEDLVAIVGHEPQLGKLVAYLIGAGDRPVIEMKKGAACLLEFDGSVEAGAARLTALLPPRVLRGFSG